MNGFVFIPTAQNGGNISIFNRNRRETATFTDGDTLTALFTARENGRATLRTADDFTFSVPADSIRGEVGDTLHFKVVKQDKSGLALRQMFASVLDAKQQRGNASIDDVRNVAKSLEQLNEEEAYRNENNREEQVKVAQIVAQVRRSQQNIGNSGQAAVAAIAASGLDLHKISFFTLSNVIQEIETDINLNIPENIPENIENAENIKNAENTENSNISDAPTKKPTNTPVSPSVPAPSPQELQNLRNMPIENLPDAAVAYLLRSGKEITPERIYTARYSTAHETPLELVGWDSLDKQIGKRFEREGIENTAKNLETARFLVAYNIPIDRRSMEYATLLQYSKPKATANYDNHEPPHF
ncbi:MAG: hypothetical protein FWG68_02405 [Defluviitaleaceae bacterium]|nr:hypothetical protein [Defluviitaleaceae bacterium]